MRRSVLPLVALLPVVLVTACGQPDAPASAPPSPSSSASSGPPRTSLSLHPVVAVGETAAGPVDRSTGGTAVDSEGQLLELGPAVLTGEDVARATTAVEEGSSAVTVEWRPSATGAWESLTSNAACNPPGDVTRRIAFVLDGEVVSSPQVDVAVGCGEGILGGTTSIRGDFSAAEAQELAERLDPSAG